MRRPLRPLITGCAGALLLLAVGCDGSQAATMPNFRAKAVEAVRSRLDAHTARLETRKARDLYEVKLWMPDASPEKEKLVAICWFDEQRRLVLVRYVD
jgi:hypothetical protein